MQYRSFGNLGWTVSEIGFGAWAIGGDMWGPQDDAESLRALNRAIDNGVNFIDTAQGYGKGHSEELIGRVLKERRGETLYVATKVPAQPGSPWPIPRSARADDFFPGSYIIKQCELSLKRLGRDTIDVYQFHTWNSSFNVEGEWVEAMMKLKQEGKIRAVGVSVPDARPESIAGALALGTVQVVQVIYNIFEQFPRWDLFPVSEKLGAGIIVRVPFDEGALTGKYTEATRFPEGDVRRHYFRGRNLASVVRRVKQIEEFKNRRHPEMSLAEYALRFCLGHPAVGTVIPGMRTAAQADLNVAASDGVLLDQGELRSLEQFAWRKDFWAEEVEN
jgi:aryl-alcohol dehydrogenase-like predicted oxidoreductase